MDEEMKCFVCGKECDSLLRLGDGRFLCADCYQKMKEKTAFGEHIQMPVNREQRRALKFCKAPKRKSGRR
jgi:NMD protein affecting ribosome stability and mRNA decay